MFAGLFKRRDGELAGSPTPLEIQRQRQVENLKKLNPTIIELSRGEEFILNISTKRETISLRIILPSQFPQVRPVVIISPPAQHPWISDQMVVIGAPELNNFTIHSELGQIVLGIVEEFQSNPPHTLGIKVVDSLPYSLNSLNKTATTSTVANAVYKPGSGKTVLHLPFPTISNFQQPGGLLLTEFPDLKSLSTKELQDLQNDEDKFQEYIERLHLVKKWNEEQEELFQINADLARENVKREPVLEINKKKLLETVDKVSSLRYHFDEFSHKYQELSEQYSPTSIQESLKFAALQAEDESEKIAESFLDGKIEIEEFLSKFMERRILSHSRKAKEERLNQQLMELKKSGF